MIALCPPLRYDDASFAVSVLSDSSPIPPVKRWDFFYPQVASHITLGVSRFDARE